MFVTFKNQSKATKQNMTTPFDKYKNVEQCASDIAELLVDGHKHTTLENLRIAVNALRKKQYIHGSCEIQADA